MQEHEADEQAEIEELATLVAVDKIDKDTLRAVKEGRLKIGHEDIKFLVNAYWDCQQQRKRYQNRDRTVGNQDFVDWMLKQSARLEAQLLAALKVWTKVDTVSVWATSNTGVGPVTAAVLRGYVDFQSVLANGRRLETASQVWAFCGLRPGQKKQKGVKQPWCATLKRAMHNLGEVFKRNHNRSSCFYGKVYEQRKASEVAKNLSKDFESQALSIAAEWKKGKKTTSVSYKEYYTKGFLPPAHIDKRACRYAVKLFLAHWFEVGYREERGEDPPDPYPMARLDHAHKIEVPVSV